MSRLTRVRDAVRRRASLGAELVVAVGLLGGAAVAFLFAAILSALPVVLVIAAAAVALKWVLG